MGKELLNNRMDFLSQSPALTLGAPATPHLLTAAGYWIWVGAHPVPAGHALRAKEWMHHVGKRLKFIK